MAKNLTKKDLLDLRSKGLNWKEIQSLLAVPEKSKKKVKLMWYQLPDYSKKSRR